MMRVLFLITICQTLAGCIETSYATAPVDHDERNTASHHTSDQRTLCTKVTIRPTCNHAPLHDATHLADDRFVAEEVRAHEMDLALIDSATNGVFRQAVAELADRLGDKPFTCLEDANGLDTLFLPPTSNKEHELRNSMYGIAIAFSQAERSGSSNPFRAKMTAYRKLFTH